MVVRPFMRAHQPARSRNVHRQDVRGKREEGTVVPARASGLPTSKQPVSKPIPKQASVKKKWRQESAKRVDICKRRLLKLGKKTIINLAVDFESPRVIDSGGPNPKRLLVRNPSWRPLPLPRFYDLLAGELAEEITGAASKVA